MSDAKQPSPEQGEPLPKKPVPAYDEDPDWDGHGEPKTIKFYRAQDVERYIAEVEELLNPSTGISDDLPPWEPKAEQGEPLDAGHRYELPSLDGEHHQVLQFVKREGEKFPGNIGHYPGTTTQAVLRCLIDRAFYVNRQIPDERNLETIRLMRRVILLLEQRAAERHGFALSPTPEAIEQCEVDAENGHLTSLWNPIAEAEQGEQEGTFEAWWESDKQWSVARSLEGQDDCDECCKTYARAAWQASQSATVDSRGVEIHNAAIESAAQDVEHSIAEGVPPQYFSKYVRALKRTAPKTDGGE